MPASMRLVQGRVHALKLVTSRHDSGAVYAWQMAEGAFDGAARWQAAAKRHGKIPETAIREGLRESNRHCVWQEDSFRVSTAANALVTSLIGLPRARKHVDRVLCPMEKGQGRSRST
jgi:hypothetical protein